MGLYRDSGNLYAIYFFQEGGVSFGQKKTTQCMFYSRVMLFANILLI